MRRTARRRFRGIARALVVLIVAVGGFALYTVYLAGAFKTIEPHFEGSCRRVVGIVGAEDMALAADGRHVFLSADDRRQTRAGHPVPGGIWLYDLESEALPLNVTPQAGPDFHPHGIALWNDPAGGGRLFVVNHPDEGRMGDGEGRQTVEVFDWVEGGLVHTITLADPLLRSPNGIAATGPDSFYVSNDHGLSGKLRQVEDWLRLARSNVIYFDGHGFRQAAGGISFANGIAVSA
ncbi:MAG TPA: hypothetical protein VEU47_10595, partial [Candidatus Cybelea sp.]|nr:hypothetical protein [Candidatus Cybelea sp.]